MNRQRDRELKVALNKLVFRNLTGPHLSFFTFWEKEWFQVLTSNQTQYHTPEVITVFERKEIKIIGHSTL
jgi:hypothetical protein